MTTAPNTERDRFYQLRDARTVAYLERNGPPVLAPVAVHADDDACATQAGQLALLTLVNQLMRFHRVVRVFTSNPDVALLTPSVRGGVTLRDELVSLAASIDPYSQFDIHTRLATYPAAVSIGLGENCRADLDWYLGCERSVGELGNSPSSLGHGSSSDLRGAGVAAVLGASAIMQGVLGMPVVPRKLSAWNFEEGDAADPGPAALPAVDVGRTLMVGAGAVATSVVYWLMQWGNCGPWTVVDADRVALHNTNRCVLFFPADAGWINGPVRSKARCLEQYLSDVRAIDKWYDEAVEAHPDIFDTVLVLANERDVRTLVSHRNDSHTVPSDHESTLARTTAPPHRRRRRLPPLPHVGSPSTDLELQRGPHRDRRQPRSAGCGPTVSIGGQRFDVGERTPAPSARPIGLIASKCLGLGLQVDAPNGPERHPAL